MFMQRQGSCKSDKMKIERKRERWFFVSHYEGKSLYETTFFAGDAGIHSLSCLKLPTIGSVVFGRSQR